MHVNNACMLYAPYASIVVWKFQNGAKTLVKLGAGQKLTCFDQLRKGCHVFFFTTIGPAHQFNEIILFQNSPVQPLPTPDEESPP
jgi:hypothetical protein